MKSYLLIAAVVFLFAIAFKPVRGLIVSLFKFIHRSVAPFVTSLIGLVIKAHIDLFKNLLPRDVVIKTLDAEKPTKRGISNE